MGDPGPVFRRPDDKPYAVRQYRGTQLRFFETTVTAADLDPHIYTPHVCRQTWADWFRTVTRDVVRLCDEGGWKSTEWTRYTKLGTPRLAADVEAHGWAFSDASQSVRLQNEIRSSGTIEAQS